MTRNITAEIVAIGTEILLGEITDTNSVFIAKTLRDLGINVYYMTSVGDNVNRIADAIKIALKRADIVFTCGGLGPTIDDMTRQGIATAVERELIFDENLYKQIEARFVNFRVKMTENNKRQAYLPTGSIPIENPVGTAPSFITEVDEKIIITLPGVPRELKYLTNESIIPYLQKRYQLGIIRARNLRVAGIGESALDEMIGLELLEGSNPSIGLAAHHGVIDVRITAKGETSAQVDKMLDDHEILVKEKIEDFVFGKDKDTIEATLFNALKTHGKKISVIEAGINAVTPHLQNPNVSDIVGRVEYYENPSKLQEEIQIESDSVREYAQRLADELLKTADFSLVVISNPNIEESADNEDATVIAIAGMGQSQSRGYGFGGKSELAQGWITRWGLANIWRMTKGISL
jgi:nicotinamide-nucleotide amidase